YRSGRFRVASIQPEHELDFLGPLAKVIIGALVEPAAHGVIVDPEVEDLREIRKKVVAITAASADEQHLRLRAFELTNRPLPVPLTFETGVGLSAALPCAIRTDRPVAA